MILNIYFIALYPYGRELGINTVSKCEDELKELLGLAQTMFDTKLPPGVTMLQLFSEGSSIKKIVVQGWLGCHVTEIWICN
nr:uncharacterized aarF domain-containing protein kinase 1 [Ipomoea batatas]